MFHDYLVKIEHDERLQRYHANAARYRMLRQLKAEKSAQRPRHARADDWAGRLRNLSRRLGTPWRRNSAAGSAAADRPRATVSTSTN